MPRMKKRALITGITGQDGSYLAELLIEKGYEVHGIIRRSSTFNTSRINHIYEDPHKENAHLFLHYGDLTDGSNLNRLLHEIAPHEIYHLAAQSHVRVSFDIPEYTGDVTGLGTVRLLDAVRETKIKTKFCNAGSSEMFGNSPELPIAELTPFKPRSPYACAKVYSYFMTVNYREAYGLFAVNGIFFNHESPRRGETFVTRKIVRALSRIHSGLEDVIYLGNLDAKRDWGYAPEYVDGMWRMLQQEKPDDYVLATGESHSVREFTELAAKYFGFELIWEGKGINEIGKDRLTGQTIVRIDPKYFRPTEVNTLIGDATKARNMLKWKPQTSFSDLVKIMSEAELCVPNHKVKVQQIRNAEKSSKKYISSIS